METTRQIDDRKENRPHNRRLAKKRVQCLNKAFCFVSSSVVADSLVLRNHQILKPTKRYASHAHLQTPYI